MSSFPSLWLGRCTLGWPVWPVIGNPLLGVHPSISIVRLIMIGYCCNCLDGQLNNLASGQWLIGVTMMYWLSNWWLGHSTWYTPCGYLLLQHCPLVDDLESPFYLVYGRNSLEGRLSNLQNYCRTMGDQPRWIAVQELRNLWKLHAKLLAENWVTEPKDDRKVSRPLTLK